jgi:hypothetical protein
MTLRRRFRAVPRRRGSGGFAGCSGFAGGRAEVQSFAGNVRI